MSCAGVILNRRWKISYFIMSKQIELPTCRQFWTKGSTIKSPAVIWKYHQKNEPLKRVLTKDIFSLDYLYLCNYWLLFIFQHNVFIRYSERSEESNFLKFEIFHLRIVITLSMQKIHSYSFTKYLVFYLIFLYN